MSEKLVSVDLQNSFEARLCSDQKRVIVEVIDNSLRISEHNSSAQNCLESISLDDFIGCQLLSASEDSKIPTNERKIILSLYVRGSNQMRQQRKLAIVFDKANVDDNQADAERFVSFLYSKLQEFDEPSDIGLLKRFDNAGGKRLLFFINPRSGKQRALQQFREVVEPALRDAGFQAFASDASPSKSDNETSQSTSSEEKKKFNHPLYEVKITSRANEARDFVQSANLSSYYGIVAVSGDGLLYEIVNGLQLRSDFDEAIKTPVSILPAGTGNCLAANIVHAAGESDALQTLFMNTLYALLRHNVVPFDLFACELKPKLVSDEIPKPVYSFIGLMWGLLSEIDIESESLRIFGKLRYHIYTVQRIFAPRFRTIRGRITYLPASAVSEAELRNAAHERNADGALRLRFLPPVDQPIPNDSSDAKGRKWCVMEGEFVTVNVLRVSHLVDDSLIDGEMDRFDTGVANLFVAKAGFSRVAILRQLLMFQSGNGVANSDLVVKVPVVAVRIEPFDERGIITLDGELVPFGTVQMEVVPGLGRLLARHDCPRRPHTSDNSA